MLWITDSFSFSMLPQAEVELRITPVPDPSAFLLVLGGVPKLVTQTPEMATIFCAVLGESIPRSRAQVEIRPGDVALVGQYSGPRIPVGAIRLPEEGSIRWHAVRFAAGEPVGQFRDYVSAAAVGVAV